MFRQFDPLIYNFIKSVDEKQGRSCRRWEEQSAWLRETHQELPVQKFIIVITIIAKMFNKSHDCHTSPHRAARVDVMKEVTTE